MTIWAEHTSAALTSIASQATLILPIGATEQHGPHLPVGVDAMMAEHLARSAAARVGTPERPVIVAPVLAYGSSHHHLPAAGTLSMSSATMSAVLVDLIVSAATTGFDRIVVLNGHGGNDDIARQAVRDVALRHDIVAAAASYWTIGGRAIVEIAEHHGVGPTPGHAGSFETSLMLALRPDLVAVDRPKRPVAPDPADPEPAPIPVERHRWVHRIGGYTDSPAAGNVAAGQAILKRLEELCAEWLAWFIRQPGPMEGTTP